MYIGEIRAASIVYVQVLVYCLLFSFLLFNYCTYYYHYYLNYMYRLTENGAFCYFNLIYVSNCASYSQFRLKKSPLIPQKLMVVVNTLISENQPDA